MTNNMVEVWLRLMSDAMRGAADAQQAMRSLGEFANTPDQLTLWMSRFMPNAVGTSRPEALGDWVEDTWRMMGVVPRYRYLELLERHEMLRSRLEKAEKDIQKLRKNVLAGNVPEQEAQKVLDLWEGMLQETLKTQASWLRAWTASNEGRTTKTTDSEQMDSEPETTDGDVPETTDGDVDEKTTSSD